MKKSSCHRCSKPKKWSHEVKPHWKPPTGFFNRSPRKIAGGLLRASDSFPQAMSRLNFYVNRAGKNLSVKDRARLQKAKRLLERRTP